MKKQLMAAVVIASLLSGCMVGPKYNRPKVQPPDVYRGTGDPTATPDPNSLADLKWFEVFKDEALQDLVRTALVQNFDLREAVARVDAARANLGITRSEQFPNVAASAEITTLRNASNGQFVVPAGTDRNRTFGTVLLNLLSFEVDLWGRLRRSTEAARATLLASEENRKAVVTTLVGDVAHRLLQPARTGSGTGDCEADAGHAAGIAAPDPGAPTGRRRDHAGCAPGRAIGFTARPKRFPTSSELTEQTENQISLLLGKNPGAVARGHRLTEQEQPPAVPPGLPSSLLGRRPRHPGRRAESGGRHRQHRRRQGCLLSPKSV